MSAFLLSQILIGIAFFFDLASFQFKAKKITVACFVVAASFISVHYFLLEQYTAAVIVALSATRFLVSLFSTDYRLKYLFLVLITIAGVWTYDEWFDVLAILGGYLATFAVFQPDERVMRLRMMVSSSLFILMNILIFTPVGIFVEIFFLGSNVLSYWRFYLKKQSRGVDS